MFVELFNRSWKIEFFSWPPVDFLLYFSYVIVCNHTDVRNFWDVLPYEFVGVFHSPFLPWWIWISKVDGHSSELSAYPLVLCKFTSVVGCYGQQFVLVKPIRSKKGSGRLRFRGTPPRMLDDMFYILMWSYKQIFIWPNFIGVIFNLLQNFVIDYSAILDADRLMQIYISDDIDEGNLINLSSDIKI